MLNLRTRYPGQTVDDDDYPLGRARNVSVPGDGTGTPWERDLLNDLLGLHQGLVTEAGVTASGVPDTAVLSDAITALKALTRRIGCHVNVTGEVNDEGNLTMEIVRQSVSGGFVILDAALEETTADVRLRAPGGSELYYVHFSGLVTLPDSTDNPATAELRLHASDAVRVFGVRYGASGEIAMSGGGLCGLSDIPDDEFFVQNKSGTAINIVFATLTVVRVGSAISGW